MIINLLSTTIVGSAPCVMTTILALDPFSLGKADNFMAISLRSVVWKIIVLLVYYISNTGNSDDQSIE